MSKKLIILLIIAVIAFSQPHNKGSRREEISGGYHRITDEELTQLRTAAPFMEIEKAARDFYSKHAGADLGDVVSIDKQVVSGINFKMTFKSANQSNVVIVVYSQPWTKTIRVSSVLPPIRNVTDESGRVTIDITQN